MSRFLYIEHAYKNLALWMKNGSEPVQKLKRYIHRNLALPTKMIHESIDRDESQEYLMEFAHRDIYANWQEKAGGRLKGLMPEADFEKLTATGHIRGKPKIEEGHIASGPVVAGATSFVEFIKKKDRKYLAVEMESAGVACAAASEGIAT